MLARRQVGSTAQVSIQVVGCSDIIKGSMECTGKKGEVRVEYKWGGRCLTEIGTIPRDATDLSPGSEMVVKLENVSARVTIESPFRNHCEHSSSRGEQAEVSALAKVPAVKRFIPPTALAHGGRGRGRGGMAEEAREKAAADKAAREQEAREKAAADKAACEQEAQRQAAADKAVRQEKRAADEKEVRERAARERAAAEAAEAARLAAKRAADEKEVREKAAREKAAAEAAEAAGLAAKRAADEKEVREKAAREKAARERAAAEAAEAARLAAKRAADEKEAREKAAREKAAAEAAEAARLAAKRAADEKEAREKAARERAAAEAAEAARLAAKRAADEKEAREKAARERAAAEAAEAARLAAKRAADEKEAREKAARERAAAEAAEAARLAAKRAADEKEAREKAARERAAAEAAEAARLAAKRAADEKAAREAQRAAHAAREAAAKKANDGAANGTGGEFLSLDVKGCKAKELLCADRPAPPDYLVPDGRGYVDYRHNTLLLRAYEANGGGNCLLEGMMPATGMYIHELKVNAQVLEDFMAKVKFNPVNGPSMGILDRVLIDAKSPFRLPLVNELNGDRKWTKLLKLTKGIFLVLALVRYTEGPDKGKTGGHFIVYDAWRDLLIIGPGHGVLRVGPEDRKDEDRARAFMLEHYSLVVPLRVCRLLVAANRVSETRFNTHKHYIELEAKWAEKKAKEDAKQAKREHNGELDNPGKQARG